MILRVDDLGVRRGGRWVLDGVSVTARAGELIGVVGPNGAGKSTLLAAIAGVLARGRGGVTVQGDLGYVPEAANPPGHLTGDEVIALVGAVKRATLDDGVRAALAIDDLAAQRVDRMSLGQRRRACLAAALVGTPALLVLDEPSNGLDGGGVDTLVALVRARIERGAAAVVASHDLELLDRLGARRLTLERGRVLR